MGVSILIRQSTVLKVYDQKILNFVQMRQVLLTIGLIGLLCGCKTTDIPYNFNNPSRILILPEILNEVSGISDISLSEIACVQDEIGTVFIVDLNSGEIVKEIVFDKIGDFEGITYVDSAMFILRSDGRLTKWKNFFSGQAPDLIHYPLNLETKDNEGLAYDPFENKLLISAKSKPEQKGANKLRLIYAFDLTSNTLQESPEISIHLDSLEKAAQNFGIFQTDTTIKGKIKPFNFRPSSLAVDPKTGNYYIISAEEFMLVVMNRQGRVIYMTNLDRTIFTKPEGITFLPNRDLIISNEANGQKPTLFYFTLGG
jgi:uncharacterized protein YjiK